MIFTIDRKLAIHTTLCDKRVLDSYQSAGDGSLDHRVWNIPLTVVRKSPLAPWHKWENPPLVPRVSCKGGAARNAAAVKILSVIKKHWVCTWTKDLGVYFCTFVLLRWILPGFPTGSRLSCPTCYIHTSSLTFHPTWIFLDELKFKVGRISSGKCVTLQSVGCINQNQTQWRL